MRSKFIIVCLLFGISSYALGQIKELSYTNARINFVPESVDVTAAFIDFSNASDKKLEIISAKADWAKKVELHTHSMDGGVMKMRQLEKMTIPAKGNLFLKSKSYHLMIFGLKTKLKENLKLPITLSFSNGKTQKINFEVKDILSPKKEHKHHH